MYLFHLMKYTYASPLPNVLIMQTIVRTTGMMPGALNYPDHLECWVHHYSYYLNVPFNINLALIIFLIWQKQMKSNMLDVVTFTTYKIEEVSRGFNLESEKSPLMIQLLMHTFICSSCHLSQNLLEKAAERETRQEYALAMIQCKVLKQLENLEQQKYDDEDITEDIKFLLERLGESVQDLRYSEDVSVWLSLKTNAWHAH